MGLWLKCPGCNAQNPLSSSVCLKCGRSLNNLPPAERVYLIGPAEAAPVKAAHPAHRPAAAVPVASAAPAAAAPAAKPAKQPKKPRKKKS